jgi:hypothetical protein
LESLVGATTFKTARRDFHRRFFLNFNAGYDHQAGRQQMKAAQYISLGRQSALVSFVLGTGIFGVYFQSPSFELLFFGYGFILLAGLVNLVILAAILTQASHDKDNARSLLLTCGLMLLNIPVMLFYSWCTMILLNVVRITFTNSTPFTLTDIHIVGCGGGYMDKLEVGEKKTVWVDITGDCTIHIDYLADGQRAEETVLGYVTGSMGRKMAYTIGEKDSVPF